MRNSSYEKRGVTDLLCALVEPLEKLKVCIDGSNEGIVVLERGQLIFINKRAREFLDLPSGNLVSSRRKFVDVLPSQGEPRSLRIASTVEEVLSESGPTIVYLRFDDHRVSIAKSLHQSKSGELIFLHLRVEAHEWGETEEGRILAEGTAHNYNNMLTGIIGLTDLLAREVSEGSASAHICELIRNSATKGLELGQRISGGASGANLNSRSQPLEILREMSLLLKSSLPSNIEIRCRIGKDTHDLPVPEQRLRRIFSLLILEATSELNPSGGSLSVRGDWQGSSLSIEVVTRPGLEGFSRAREAQTSRMSTLRHLVDQVDGSLTLCSSGDQKSRIFTCQSQHQGKHSTRSAESNIFSSSEQGQGQAILFVDDEEAIRLVGSTALRKVGYEVETASDGEAALKKYVQEGPFDLVILDLVMPRMGGAACFEKLREHDPQVQVILMSGFSANSRVSELLEAGCLSFLQKPFDLKDLVRATASSFTVRSRGRLADNTKSTGKRQPRRRSAQEIQ